MVRARIREATELTRRQAVPDADRTPARDAAADCIETYLAEHDWPETTIVELAEHCDWSREHISKTLDAYFDPAGIGEPDPMADLVATLSEEGEGTATQQAYRDGVLDTIAWLLDNPDVVEQLLGRRP